MAQGTVSNWTRMCSSNTNQYTGRFGEALAQAIFHGHLSRDEYGDVTHNCEGIGNVGVEVKVSDNTHSFRLCIEQFERYWYPFREGVFHSFYYVLVTYKNRAPRPDRAKKRLSLLKKCKGEAGVNLYLSRNISCVYILDIRVIAAIADFQGVVYDKFPKSPDGYRQPILNITRGLLKDYLENETLFGLALFNLPREEWAIEREDVTLKVFPEGFLDGLPLETKVVRAVHKDSWNEMIPYCVPRSDSDDVFLGDLEMSPAV